jgi:hypothetical protein
VSKRSLPVLDSYYDPDPQHWKSKQYSRDRQENLLDEPSWFKEVLGVPSAVQNHMNFFLNYYLIFISILKLDVDSLFHCGCICLFVFSSSSEKAGLKFVKF